MLIDILDSLILEFIVERFSLFGLGHSHTLLSLAHLFTMMLYLLCYPSLFFLSTFYANTKMGEELEGIFIRGIDQFRNEGMDMRVPLKITAKGMEGGDHAEVIDMVVVLEGIVSELDAFSLELTDEGSIDKSRNGVACSGEEEIEIRSVLAEPVSEAVRDGEDDMPVFSIEAERGGLGRKLFGIFDAAGITETRMTMSVNSSKVITMRV